MKRKALRAEIVRNGYTQEKVAELLGIAPKTFYLKMKRGVFTTKEAEEMIAILEIRNPSDIFFGHEVAS